MENVQNHFFLKMKSSQEKFKPFFSPSKYLFNFFIRTSFTIFFFPSSTFSTWWKKKLLYFYELAERAGNRAFCSQPRTTSHPHFSANFGTFLYKWKLDLSSGNQTFAQRYDYRIEVMRLLFYLLPQTDKASKHPDSAQLYRFFNIFYESEVNMRTQLHIILSNLFCIKFGLLIGCQASATSIKSLFFLIQSSKLTFESQSSKFLLKFSFVRFIIFGDKSTAKQFAVGFFMLIAMGRSLPVPQATYNIFLASHTSDIYKRLQQRV